MIAKNFDETFQKNFEVLKSQCEVLDDASRKSSIDARIRDLIGSINSSENYFTTSSCSGRFIAFSQVA
jgi:tRNA wybutosine-synthesizing protein 3